MTLGALTAIVVGAVAAVAVAASGSGSDGDPPAEPTALDVAIVGDSLIEQSRDQFAAHAGEQGLTVETWAFGGSAPCDWMDVFDELAASPPRRLIISFAGNDNTPCVNPDGGPPRDPRTIADAYAGFVPDILDRFADTPTEVYLVLPPPVGEPASEPAAAAIRETYRAIADDRSDVTIVDPSPLLSPDGAFHRTLPCEEWEADVCAGGEVAVRKPDGIHLEPAGGERYARALLDAIGQPVDG